MLLVLLWIPSNFCWHYGEICRMSDEKKKRTATKRQPASQNQSSFYTEIGWQSAKNTPYVRVTIPTGYINLQVRERVLITTVWTDERAIIVNVPTKHRYKGSWWIYSTLTSQTKKLPIVARSPAVPENQSMAWVFRHEYLRLMWAGFWYTIVRCLWLWKTTYLYSALFWIWSAGWQRG